MDKPPKPNARRSRVELLKKNLVSASQYQFKNFSVCIQVSESLYCQGKRAAGRNITICTTAFSSPASTTYLESRIRTDLP